MDWARLKARSTAYLPLFLSTPVFLWQLFFFAIPLCIVLGLSFLPDLKTGFTLASFEPFFREAYARILGRSLLLAFLNAVLCLIISYPTAYFISFKAGKFKLFLLFLLIVPFWTNFLLHICAWFFVLEREGLLNNTLLGLGLIHKPLHVLNTTFAVYLMTIYYYLPFMVLPLYSILEKFDYRLIEASLDLGATWFLTLRKVMIPVTLPGILSGFFLVFVPSFAEFAIPELLGGDKKMYVGSVISYYILGGTTISAGAAFTVISSLTLLFSAFVLYPLIKKVAKAL